MLQIIFGGLMGGALIYGAVQGRGEAVVGAMLAGAGEAVTSALSMAGGFAFFCGLIAILKKAGAVGALARAWRPALSRLMGKETGEEAMSYMAMNLSANMLGLGNAATPMGLEAAKRLGSGPRAGNALCLFLVINCSSVQILPTGVIALRAAAGAAQPGDIWLPTLVCSLVATAVGIVCCKLMERKG